MLKVPVSQDQGSLTVENTSLPDRRNMVNHVQFTSTWSHDTIAFFLVKRN